MHSSKHSVEHGPVPFSTASSRPILAPVAPGLLAVLGLALLLVAGCGGGDSSAPSAQPPATDPGPESVETEKSGLEVESAQVQWVPGMSMAAVYLDVVDHDGAGDRLLRAESSQAKAVETHESVTDGDTVRMVARPDGFEVPAGGTLKLEPGGKHIMLIEPQAPAEGGGFELTLVFEKAGSIPATAEVMGGAMDHGAHGDHGTMDHSEMDHGTMDHSEMDHGTMDHSEMDHGTMDHSEGGGEGGEDGSGGGR